MIVHNSSRFHRNREQGIIIIYLIALFLLLLYNLIRHKFDPITAIPKIDLPYSLKCLIPFKRCEDSYLDGWTLMHVIMHYIIGLLYPNEYLFVTGLSFGTEAVEQLVGARPRYIVDPLTNIGSYYIGNQVRKFILQNVTS